MFFGGVMKKVDKLGRIVIPLELRQKYGLTEGAAVEFADGGEGITVKPSDSVCRVCHAKINENTTFPLRESCIAKAIKAYNKR